MASWTQADLEYWDAAIRERVDEFGLNCYRQEFEICDHSQMLAYMAYHGMPAHYPHWSYGKSFEKTKTLYDYGVSGLPYELVINSDPCLAYLMADNSLLLQILTIAHVYGHNDFFKNNFTFTSATRASETVAQFKAAADRVRDYVEHPSIGIQKVEPFLDAAHALAFSRSPNAAIRRMPRREQIERRLASAEPFEDEFAELHRRPDYREPELRKVPLEPDRDVLLFVRDHNPHLQDWQRDVLTIVDEEARYFIPQMETKIMNEGWASYWHHQIMNSLELPSDLQLEFLVRHNQVVCPHPGQINPYHLGFHVWHDIERRYDADNAADDDALDGSGKSGREKIFEVRETDRDVAFLRRFLNEELMRELDLFSYQPRGRNLVVSNVSDEDGWREVKEALLRTIGTANEPVIAVTDADHGGNRTLYMVHGHDGRDLHIGYAQKTLAHVHTLWGHRVLLETEMKGKRTLLSYGEQGFDAKLMR
ncbi:MAG: SpoVR family protein [Geminicoccaceae bacterium]